jgi:hypothetical protein
MPDEGQYVLVRWKSTVVQPFGVIKGQSRHYMLELVAFWSELPADPCASIEPGMDYISRDDPADYEEDPVEAEAQLRELAFSAVEGPWHVKGASTRYTAASLGYAPARKHHD